MPADLRRILELVERPTARPAFRDALREQFLAGAVAAAAPTGGVAPAGVYTAGAARFAVDPLAVAPADVAPADVAPADVAPADVARFGANPLRSVDGAVLPPPRRRNVWVLAGALAAAAAIVVTLLLDRDRTPTWRIHGSSTAETIVVDGVPMHLADGAKLAHAIETARDLETRGGTLRLCVRDEAWIELGDDTRLSQLRFAAAGPYEIRADRGSLRVATLPAFDGRGMRVHTQDMLATVTGTVFAIDIDPMGTCLCTLEGSVHCAPVGGAAPDSVPAGRMCLAYRDGHAPEWHAAYAPHLEPLKYLRE